MSLTEDLDLFIEECLTHGLEAEGIAYMLLCEDVVLHEYGDTLLEAVKRTVIKRAGHTFLVRKRGRPNPLRSIKAKQSARKGAAKRRLAQRNPATKRKRAQARAMRPGGSRPRKLTVRRHGPPRVKRASRPTFKRPKAHRPRVGGKRPTYRSR